MSMELIPWQMMINLSEISSNYPISDPNYPEELSIPSITVNLTEGPLLTNSGNTNTFKEPWQTHFCWEQLHFWDILWHTTYYWVAILQCDNFAGNITIPRNSLDKIILIPLATTCENCKATCCLNPAHWTWMCWKPNSWGIYSTWPWCTRLILISWSLNQCQSKW